MKNEVASILRNYVVAEGIEGHRSQVETALQESDVEIRSMDLIAPSLEDVFIASVREQSPRAQMNAFEGGAA